MKTDDNRWHNNLYVIKFISKVTGLYINISSIFGIFYIIFGVFVFYYVLFHYSRNAVVYLSGRGQRFSMGILKRNKIPKLNSISKTQKNLKTNHYADLFLFWDVIFPVILQNDHQTNLGGATFTCHVTE